MKKLWMIFLNCIFFVCIAFATSCDKTELAFNEGYLEEIVLGEPIMLDEYIDPSLTDDYTAILTCDETGQERDLKELVQWTTDRPGTYTLTYTVKSGAYKGTVSTKINVVVAEVEWTYSNPTLVYRVGETMSFNLLKRNLNIAVESYYDFEFFVKEVTYNGKAEDLRGKTSYTFPEHGDFVFTFGVETKDGQVLTADHKMNVRKQQVMEAGAQEWLDENNITVEQEGYVYISPTGRVELDAGYYTGSYTRDYVPYLAFNGEDENGYGSNTYVMTDFTGKNLPQVAFFCKDVKASFTDGDDGVLFYNAFGESRWKDSVHLGRFVVYGPNKAGYAEFDNKGRLISDVGQGNTCPASWSGLDENCQYRYIVGIEEAKSVSMVVRILLINLTTSERVLDYTQKVDSWLGVGGTEYLKDTIDESYYSGSIVLYGRYGFDLTLDKVYTPITGVSDIYELDQATQFKDGFAKYYDKGDTANVADYAELSDGDTFRVVDPEGEEVTIATDGSFTYAKSGAYRLYFISSDVNIRQSSTTVNVMYDLDNPMVADQLEKDGALAALTSNQIAVTNTVTDYIKEGAQSIRFYTINASETLDIYLTKEFTNFVFMNRKVQGVKFDIYSPNAIGYRLKALTDDTTNAAYLREDYTGTIAAETWTTVTLSRDLIMKNYATYGKQNYAIALTLVGSFAAQSGCVYVDDVQLVLEDVNGTVATEAQSFMTANNITAYAYNSINADMSVSLQKGYYQGYPLAGASPWMSNDDVPYIAYNGNYGAGSYVVVDFTGKNIPQLCFFAKEVTSSLLDGKAGIYVHTGMVYPNGDNVALHDSRRVTFFGPNKIEYGHIDNQGRLGDYGYNGTEGSESPFSINELVDGTHYRYIVGIKSISGDDAVYELLLINLDTNETVAELTHTTKKASGGNIVIYGRYNYAITLDKIYDVYENVTDINAIDKVAEVFGA